MCKITEKLVHIALHTGNPNPCATVDNLVAMAHGTRCVIIVDRQHREIHLYKGYDFDDTVVTRAYAFVSELNLHIDSHMLFTRRTVLDAFGDVWSIVRHNKEMLLV